MGAKIPIPFLSPAARRNDDVSDIWTPGTRADFSDPESQRVLTTAARVMARELGRQAARDYFAEAIGQPKRF